jgi:TolB-like protein
MMSTTGVTKTAGQFSDDLILEQLQKIFLCSSFSVSDILRKFLNYIIQETLAGRSNTIKEYTIAVNVLNKPVSFKPQHDAIVRIHAGRLRRALNYYYKEEGSGDAIEITVPKGSYVPVFGSLRVAEPMMQPDANPEIPERSSDSIALAIMPFKTFETDISRLAFVDSLGEQLSAEFGRFPDFSVVSYYTTQQLTLKDKEIKELASSFGAQYVVTGNVQFEPRRLRVAVQLTDAYTGAQIWTELYHRTFNASNLFEVADNIVTHIIAVLGDFNGIIMQQMAKGLIRDRSGKSYSTILYHYHDFFSTLDEKGFKKAYVAMEQAVEQEPANEIAWAFLGMLSLLAFLFNQPTRENPLIQGLRCAQRSLKINPMNQHGHIALAMANIFLNNKEEGLEALKYALKLNPNATGLTGIIGCLMIGMGEYNNGMNLVGKSISRNKTYPDVFNLFISLYHFKRKEYTLAYEFSEKTARPDLILSRLLSVSSLIHMGRKSEADAIVKMLRGFSLNKAWTSREYISRFLPDQDLVEQLYQGLKLSNIPLLTVA